MSAKTILLTLALVAASAATRPSDPGVHLHFALSRSMPEADSAVPAPQEVRLWFTEVPQENSTSVRLIDSGGEAVETGPLEQEAEDGKIFHVAIGDALAAGGYTVSWRAIGADGHVVRGDFAFTVTAQ